jgi:DNA-binding MarR family transcriptional regulator
MDHLSHQEVTAFGSRLRRLLDRMDREVLAVYRAAGEEFEPRWYGVFTALRDHGPLTVGDLSQRLGVSHAAVSQVRTALEARGLVAGVADPEDGRRQRLSLTPEGHETARRLAPLWAAIGAGVGELLGAHAPALLTGLDNLESALDHRPLRDRVGASLPPGETA